MKFSENIKYLRKKEKLTQEQLADKLKVSRQAVTKWESGQTLPDLTNLKDIAVFFGVTIDELLGDDKIANATSLEKRLKDLPLYLFGSVMAILFFISELGIKDITAVGFIIILFIPLEAYSLKVYLTDRRTIDLTDTKEGKKVRLRFILTEAAIISSIEGVIQLVIYVVRNLRGLEKTNSIASIIVMTIMSFIILVIVRFLTLRDEVKEYNKKENDTKSKK